MRFVTYTSRIQKSPSLAIRTDKALVALAPGHAHGVPGDLLELMQGGRPALESAAAIILAHGAPLDEGEITFLPPLPRPPKIICVGLNYLAHTSEGKFEQPGYPTLFLRVSTSLVGHMDSLVRPLCSHQFDYEGELVAFIGTGGRHIKKSDALQHVIAYSIGNEGSVRDYQFKSPQWTVGKNFDRSGSIGPMFVSADELPAGGMGLKIETRLNGVTVQSANTSEMVFDLATVIAIVSEAMTLEAGDVIFTGTPAGVGAARKPPLFMKTGDVVTIEVEGLGILQNSVIDEQA